MLIDIHTHRTITEHNTLQILSIYKDAEQAIFGGYCSIGIHPCYLEHHDQQLNALKRYAAEPNVLAIGECGLDSLCNKDAALQASLFRQQVVLASQLSKPLMIHCVRAFDELLHTINELQPTVPAIVHGYNKKQEVANRLLGAGMYLSFGAAILNSSWPAAAVLEHIPANRFFLETDDADVSINEIYERAASIRKTERETLILQLQQNFRNVFKREL